MFYHLIILAHLWVAEHWNTRTGILNQHSTPHTGRFRQSPSRRSCRWFGHDIHWYRLI